MSSKRCTQSSDVHGSEVGFRPALGHVAGINIGTYCCVAYTLEGSKDLFKFPLGGPGFHTVVPNAILIERETNTVAEFGYRAKHRFTRLRKQWDYRYFELILHHIPVSLFVRLHLPLKCGSN